LKRQTIELAGGSTPFVAVVGRHRTACRNAAERALSVKRSRRRAVRPACSESKSTG
jgi:hypothetical protein